MPMSLKTTGFPETQAALAQLQQLVRTEATRGAVAAGAVVIRDAMAESAPTLDERTARSTALPRGALKVDIGVRMHPADREGYITAEIGPRKHAQVAWWVEFGHRLVKGGYSKLLVGGRHRGGGSLIGDVPAHPFLRPAYEASWRKSLEEFRAELKRRLARYVS